MSSTISQQPSTSLEFRDVVELQRSDVAKIAARVKALKRHSIMGQVPMEPRSEIIANITLAYRHLEDARMRLGKVLQHLEGGESKYDEARRVTGKDEAID